MIRRPPSSPLFPSPTLFRSSHFPDRSNRIGELAQPLLELVQLPPPVAANGRAGEKQTADASLHVGGRAVGDRNHTPALDRKSTRLNSSHSQISYAAFCLKKK